MKLLFWVHVCETLNAAFLVENVTFAKQRSSGGGLTFSQRFNSEVQPNYCGSTAVAQFRRASIPTSESRHFSVELRTSRVLLLCCDRDVAVRNGGAAAEVIASTAARCSPLQLKITLHHKTRRTEWGEAFCLSPLFFPSITHYPASRTKSNLFSPFIFCTLTGFPPIFSVRLQLEVSTSKALAPVKTLLTIQVQLTASAHVAITGCASPQLNTGSKSGALFLLGVLRVGVWS